MQIYAILKKQVDADSDARKKKISFFLASLFALLV